MNTMKIMQIDDCNLEMIKNAQNIALFAHKNPDGDAYGSSLAMKKVLENMGKTVQLFLPDVSDVYSFLPGFSDIKTSFDYADYDLLIIFDCSDFHRLDKFYHTQPEYFSEKFHDKTIVVDHHLASSDPFMINSDHILQYHWYSSTCELVYDLFFQALEPYFDAEVATCLLLGIYTDTGSFKYGGHPENSFHVAGKLVNLGADKDLIVNEYMKGRSLNEVRFAAYLIDRVATIGNIMYTRYTDEDLCKFGIDTERATLALNILQTVKWKGIVSVVRYVDGILKFSMRSVGNLNVGEIARERGGGGHKNAAGFSLVLAEGEKYEEKIIQVWNEIIGE